VQALEYRQLFSIGARTVPVYLINRAAHDRGLSTDDQGLAVESVYVTPRRRCPSTIIVRLRETPPRTGPQYYFALSLDVDRVAEQMARDAATHFRILRVASGSYTCRTTHDIDPSRPANDRHRHAQ